MNRTADYASKNDGKYVSVEDCRKIERELDFVDEKLANARLAIDKIKAEITKHQREDKLDYSYTRGLVFAVTTIEAEINKIIRRR